MIASRSSISRVAVAGHRGVRLWLAVSLAVCGTPLQAQDAQPAAPDRKPANWKELNIPEPPGGYKAVQGEAHTMLRTGQFSNRDNFDAYWKWFIAQLSKYESRDDLPNVRNVLQKQLRGRSGPPQQRLVREIALPIAAAIARDEGYAPVSRINALYLLGDLNQKEPDPQGRGAIALPEALPILIEFLDPKRPADGGVNDALRLAAIVGIQNHIDRGGIQDGNLRKRAVTLLQQLAKNEPGAAERSPDVANWLQRRAQETLDKLEGTAVAERPREVAAGGPGR